MSMAQKHIHLYFTPPVISAVGSFALADAKIAEYTGL